MSQMSTLQIQLNVVSTLVRSVCSRLILILFLYSLRAHMTRPQATVKLPWMTLVKLTTDRNDEVCSVYHDFSLHFISPVAAAAAVGVAHLESQCARLGACFHSQSSCDAHCCVHVPVHVHVRSYIHDIRFSLQ